MEKRTGAAKKTRQKAKSSGGSNTKRIFLGVLIVICVMVAGVGCGFLTASMNTKDNLSDVKPPASSQIFDINGNEVATVHADENRVPVSIKQKAGLYILLSSLRQSQVLPRYKEHRPPHGQWNFRQH